MKGFISKTNVDVSAANDVAEQTRGACLKLEEQMRDVQASLDELSNVNLRNDLGAINGQLQAIMADALAAQDATNLKGEELKAHEAAWVSSQRAVASLEAENERLARHLGLLRAVMENIKADTENDIAVLREALEVACRAADAEHTAFSDAERRCVITAERLDALHKERNRLLELLAAAEADLSRTRAARAQAIAQERSVNVAKEISLSNLKRSEGQLEELRRGVKSDEAAFEADLKEVKKLHAEDVTRHDARISALVAEVSESRDRIERLRRDLAASQNFAKGQVAKLQADRVATQALTDSARAGHATSSATIAEMAVLMEQKERTVLNERDEAFRKRLEEEAHRSDGARSTERRAAMESALRHEVEREKLRLEFIRALDEERTRMRVSRFDVTCA